MSTIHSESSEVQMTLVFICQQFAMLGFCLHINPSYTDLHKVRTKRHHLLSLMPRPKVSSCQKSGHEHNGHLTSYCEPREGRLVGTRQDLPRHKTPIPGQASQSCRFEAKQAAAAGDEQSAVLTDCFVPWTMQSKKS